MVEIVQPVIEGMLRPWIVRQAWILIALLGFMALLVVVVVDPTETSTRAMAVLIASVIFVVLTLVFLQRGSLKWDRTRPWGERVAATPLWPTEAVDAVDWPYQAMLLVLCVPIFHLSLHPNDSGARVTIVAGVVGAAAASGAMLYGWGKGWRGK